LSFLILLRCDRDYIRSYLELCEVDFYLEPRVLLVTGFSNDWTEFYYSFFAPSSLASFLFDPYSTSLKMLTIFDWVRLSFLMFCSEYTCCAISSQSIKESSEILNSSYAIISERDSCKEDGLGITVLSCYGAF
jgi:hypothetical protein